MKVPLRNRQGVVIAWAEVDDADAALVTDFKWSLTNEGYAASVARDGDRWRAIKMSRVIMDLTWGDPGSVDHINRNKLDNRRVNLRVVTHSQNHQNRAASGNRNGSSRFRGVSKRGRKWRAYVTVDRKRRYLGDHESEEAAADAAREARRQLMPYANC